MNATNHNIAMQDFEYICSLVRDHSGVVLDEGKRYLVELRLGQLVEREGLGSVNRVVEMIRQGGSQDLRTKVVEVMCTNETYFFRDVHPFDALRTVVIPDRLANNPEGVLHIWSAASSTGQEPYSVAMIIKDHFSHLSSDAVRLYGSDLSREMVARARQGEFSQIEVNRGLPAPLMVRHFEKRREFWVVRPELRSMIEFFQMNLTGPWPALPRMDLIMLRNVMIYFDLETKIRILNNVKTRLKPGGWLLLGAAETTLMIDEGFRRVEAGKASFYQVVDNQT